MTAIEPVAAGRPNRPNLPDGAWSDRIRAVRDRLLSSDRFRRWATAFPLTRPLARRRARALFDLCGGFVYTQILFASVQLGLFDILSEGPQTPEILASRLSLPTDSTLRLLAAAASLRLVERRSEGRFGLGPLGTAMVDNDAVTAMVRHHALLYRDLADPVALLRGEPAETELSRYWAYARSDNPIKLSAEETASYTALMAASQSMIAGEILRAYSFSRHRCLLDIGGGDGTFLTAVSAQAPTLKLILFDLPQVVERARARLGSGDAASHITTVGGDFHATPLPGGADIVSLVRVLHDHDDDAALTLLSAIRRALPPDGALLIAEPMSQTRGSEPVGDAYFGIYLLAMRSGRPRTAEEIRALLRAAGFRTIRPVPTGNPVLVRLLLAKP